VPRLGITAATCAGSGLARVAAVPLSEACFTGARAGTPTASTSEEIRMYIGVGTIILILIILLLVWLFRGRTV
jgi:hypothetical protein